MSDTPESSPPVAPAPGTIAELRAALDTLDGLTEELHVEWPFADLDDEMSEDEKKDVFWQALTTALRLRHLLEPDQSVPGGE